MTLLNAYPPAPQSNDAALALEAAAALENAHAEAIVEWAVAMLGDTICVGTSFTDTVLVHLVTRVAPDIEVVFADTGFHFPETLDTMKRAQARYRLNLKVVRPAFDAPDVWADGPEACCAARKVDAVATAMTAIGATAWFSGLRRVDSPTRARAKAVEIGTGGRIRVNPLVAWNDADVAAYVAKHDLIVNPLTERGYPSIGCWPCTSPVAIGSDPRSGRWVGFGKTECGLNR